MSNAPQPLVMHHACRRLTRAEQTADARIMPDRGYLSFSFDCFGLLPTASRAQILGQLMFPDHAIVGLLGIADLVLRLASSIRQEGHDRVTSSA